MSVTEISETLRGRLLKRQEVLQRIPFSLASLWRLIKLEKFPAPIHLAPKIIVWPEEEIDAWLAQRAAERDATEPLA